MEDSTTKIFSSSVPFRFQNGAELPELTVAYETYGSLNEHCDNAILVCHALTGNANAAGVASYSEELLKEAPLLAAVETGKSGWWDGMIGPGKTFDTDKYFVICSNIIGSCYGSSGPASINPNTGQFYRTAFPRVTVRDMVHTQYLLLRHLGVESLLTISGGSLGGMQVLEWVLLYPDFVRSIIPIATAARHSAWCIGLNHLAREAIFNDPNWQNGIYTQQPVKGLQLARKVGMISYRSDLDFNEKFGRRRLSDNGKLPEDENIFQVESYLNYQGQKLVDRFDANSFLYLSRAMDAHDVGRERGGYQQALSTIRARALCIGIDSDILYPAHEQREIAAYIPNAKYAEIKSIHGHDGFLIEFQQMENLITPFLEKVG